MKFKWIYLLLIFFSFFVYFNSFFNPFIWDDFSLVVDNPYVKNLKLSFSSFSKDIYFGVSNFYRPLQIILYSLIYKFSKLNPLGYHLLNILLHIGCAILFFILLKDIYGEKVSFLVSLLWAIHPINTEAITYISGLADPLFLFFGLLGIYFYSFSTLISSSLTNKKRKTFLIFSYISFIFSLLSKETGVLILPLFFLYLYATERLTKDEIENYIFLSCIFLIYFILRRTILNFGKISTEEIFIYRFYTGFRAFLVYISILLFPFILSMERHIPYIKTAKNIDFIVGFIYFLLFIWFIYKKRENKKLFFAGSLFILNFLFHSNIFIPLNGNLREHWMYLGGIGFFIYIILGLEKIKKEKLKLILIILIFSLYGIRTILRNYDWKEPEKFYLKSIKYSYYPSLLYGNLCYYYLRNGYYEKSYQFSKKAILLGLKNESIFYVYGLSLLNRGEYNEAEKVFYEILKLNPQNYETLTELGWLYYIKGNNERAIEFLNKSLKINQNYPKTYYILSEIYKRRLDWKNFLIIIEKLNKIMPDDFYPYYLKGLIFKGIGDFKKSNENFQKAYKILKNKNDYNSLFNMGILLREMGKIEDSLELFNRLLKLKSENLEVLNEIGICYAIKGDKAKAKKIWIEILSKNPDYLPAKENLKKIDF